MKKNKILYVLVFAVLFVVIIDAFLFFQTKKINQNIDVNIIDSKKGIACNKIVNKIMDEEVGIEYKVVMTYDFSVDKNSEILPNGHLSILIFDNIGDLEFYYDYLINSSKIIVSEAFNRILSKDEDNLTLSYYTNEIQFGYKYYSDEYLEILKKSGYTCEETVINIYKE